MSETSNAAEYLASDPATTSADARTLEDHPPVIMFGESLTGLGSLRCLASARIASFAVCPEDALPRRSRWYRPLPGTETRVPRPADLPDFLEGLSLPRAVLLPCADDWAEAVARLPENLKRRFPSSISSADVISTMVDKWRFAQTLERLGIPHPETELVESLDQLRSLPEEKFPNRFLKPLNSLQFSKRHGIKAFLIKNKADALSIMAKGDAAGTTDFPILLQQYVAGPPTNHYFIDGFVDRHGRVCTLFARKRLRMFPPTLGNSTFMVSTTTDAVQGAIDSLKALLAGTGYRGIFSAEYKLDDRDGVFKILEVNARPWWFIEFAARAGVNVCAMSYQDALERPVADVSIYRVGLRCVFLPNDIKLLTSSKRGLVENLRWARSLVGAHHCLSRWNDMWPAVTYFASVFSRRSKG